MAIRLEAKRPSEVRDYQVDWSDFLGSDTISSQTFTASGVTVDSSAIDSGSKGVTGWVSGGTAGTIATITNTILTAGGRTETEILTLRISDGDEPITLAELKAHLRKTTDDEDGLIASFGVAAREWCEDYTGHILVPRQVTDSFSAWGGYLTLRYQPITVDDPTPALTVTYLDADGNEIEYESRVIRDQRYPWAIYPAIGGSFPTLASNGTVSVVYTAGYATSEEVPEKFRWAIKLLAASMFENRGSIDEAAAQAVRFILRSYRGAVMA